MPNTELGSNTYLLFTSYNNIMRYIVLFPFFTEEEMEAQKHSLTCSDLYEWWTWDLLLALSDTKAYVLAHNT